VTRGKARPLRPTSCIEASCRGACCKERSQRWSLWLPCRPPAPQLEEPRSIETDLSRPLSFSRAPPCSGPNAKRQLSAPSIGFRRLRRVRPVRTELPLDDAGKASSSMSWTRSVVSCSEHSRAHRIREAVAVTPVVSRIAHPFATALSRAMNLAEHRRPTSLWGHRYVTCRTSRESCRC
jgi:hypothetical protein